jgi:hypothetical protein
VTESKAGMGTRPGNGRGWKIAAILLGAVFLISMALGFVHVVYGGGIGLTVVTKEEWELHDTFVDWSEIEEMNLFEIAGSGHKGVVRALLREGYLPELEARLRRLQEVSADLRRASDDLEQASE